MTIKTDKIEINLRAENDLRISAFFIKKAGQFVIAFDVIEVD